MHNIAAHFFSNKSVEIENDEFVNSCFFSFLIFKMVEAVMQKEPETLHQCGPLGGLLG